MSDENYRKAKNDLLHQANALIEEFCPSPGISSDFDWAVCLARRDGQYIIRVQTGGNETHEWPAGFVGWVPSKEDARPAAPPRQWNYPMGQPPRYEHFPTSQMVEAGKAAYFDQPAQYQGAYVQDLVTAIWTAMETARAK